MPHEQHDDDPHSLLPPDPQLQVKALETLLSEKGLIERDALDAIIDVYQNQIGPQIGAEIVAKAWSDPVFKSALLRDSEAVLHEAGLAGRQGEHVVEAHQGGGSAQLRATIHAQRAHKGC